MKELIVSYMKDADSGHLTNEGKPLTDNEKNLVIGVLQMICADAFARKLLEE